MSDRSFCCSFQKSDKESNRSFTLSKRAKEQKGGIAHYLYEQMLGNHSFAQSLIPHF